MSYPERQRLADIQAAIDAIRSVGGGCKPAALELVAVPRCLPGSLPSVRELCPELGHPRWLHSGSSARYEPVPGPDLVAFLKPLGRVDAAPVEPGAAG
jgi:hypothetical protein